METSRGEANSAVKCLATLTSIRDVVYDCRMPIVEFGVLHGKSSACFASAPSNDYEGIYSHPSNLLVEFLKEL